MKTELTKKQTKSLCSKDDLKPALKGLLYEPTKNRLTACNGACFVSYKVESNKNDSKAIISPELFKSKLSDTCDYKINGVAVREQGNNKSEYAIRNYHEYPDIDSVTPDESTFNHVEIGISLDQLKMLCDAVPKDGNKAKNIKLIINTENPLSGIKFSQINNNDPQYSGVIMPVRIGNK